METKPSPQLITECNVIKVNWRVHQEDNTGALGF